MLPRTQELLLQAVLVQPLLVVGGVVGGVAPCLAMQLEAVAEAVAVVEEEDTAACLDDPVEEVEDPASLVVVLEVSEVSACQEVRAWEGFKEGGVVHRWDRWVG